MKKIVVLSVSTINFTGLGKKKFVPRRPTAASSSDCESLKIIYKKINVKLLLGLLSLASRLIVTRHS